MSKSITDHLRLIAKGPLPCVGDDDAIVAAADLIDRLSRGDFTPDEIQRFCHKIAETEPAARFAGGCTEYQRRVYGCAPDADKVADIEARLKRIVIAYDAEHADDLIEAMDAERKAFGFVLADEDRE